MKEINIGDVFKQVEKIEESIFYDERLCFHHYPKREVYIYIEVVDIYKNTACIRRLGRLEIIEIKDFDHMEKLGN